MKYTQDGSSYIVRIDRGEDVMAKLAEFARETDIGSATITGIGAASELELGIYNAEISAYKHYTYTGDLEIISLTGNITKKDGAYMSIFTAWSRTARTSPSAAMSNVASLSARANCAYTHSKRPTREDWTKKRDFTS